MPDKSSFRRVWERLTEPSTKIADQTERRKARLLSALLITLLPIGALTTTIAPLVDGRSVMADLDVLVLSVSAVFWLVTYGVSRSRFYRVAVWMAVLTGFLAIVVIVILDVDFINLYSLVMISMFTTVMFSVFEAVILNLMLLLGIVLVPVFQPELSIGRILSTAFPFVVIGMILNVLIIRHIFLIEQDRQAELTESEARYRRLMEHSFDGVAVCRRDRLVDVNFGFSRLFGYSSREMLGLPILDLFSEKGREQVKIHLAHGGVFEAVGRRKDGAKIHLEVFTRGSGASRQEMTQLFAVRDISERKIVEQRLFHEAFHDPLTDLPNRALLYDRLHRALERSRRRPGLQTALLFIDLDGFKEVNDTFGHAVGDWVLVEIAHRLLSSVRKVDTVARYGGDEFVILLDDLKDENVEDVFRRLFICFETPIIIDTYRTNLHASVGIVPDISAFRSKEEILQKADLAMYQAKNSPSRHYVISSLVD